MPCHSHAILHWYENQADLEAVPHIKNINNATGQKPLTSLHGAHNNGPVTRKCGLMWILKKIHSFSNCSKESVH